MTTEREMEELAEHLQEVRPIFDEFCAMHGFAHVARGSIGRYPRLRIEKPGVVKIWFDLWMELDEQGRRFEKFRRDLPYELSTGAYVDEDDGSKYGVRFSIALSCFKHVPFDQVAPLLMPEMEKQLAILSTWTVAYLKQNGDKMRLG